MLKKIEDSDVHNIWACKSVLCNNEDEVDISPDWYQQNGTPVCPDCDEDMDYQHTKIKS